VDDPHGQGWIGEARLVAAVTWPAVSTLRTELEAVRACARDIATLAGERCALIEYGSGGGVEVRPLLDAFTIENLPIAAYVPIDLSREQLAEVVSRIAAECPCSAIQPV
jgi:uncharacterized SAM-dependent methyltransferase